MEKENPVYLKFGYYESLGAKRNILSSEESLLNLVKIMRRYNALHGEELRMKSYMGKLMKELNSKVKETISFFPFFEIPKKFRKEEIKIEKREEPVRQIAKPEVKIPLEKYDRSLESELQDIQSRLKAIEKV
jgi:hypothetical protein